MNPNVGSLLAIPLHCMDCRHAWEPPPGRATYWTGITLGVVLEIGALAAFAAKDWTEAALGLAIAGAVVFSVVESKLGRFRR